jgi:hypothetical protein
MTTLEERLRALQRPAGPLEPIRKGSGPISQALALGPLAALPGSWTGVGFNAIWRPFHPIPPENNHHFVMLNATKETLTFEVIPGAVPNRGVLQPDINLYGLHYLQQISERGSEGQALHIEPGLWMNIPPTEDPADQYSTLARLASIPHGNALLLQTEGEPYEVIGGAPDIPPLNPMAPLFPASPDKPYSEVTGITPFKTPEMSAAGSLVPEPKEEQDLAKDLGVAGGATNSNGPYSAPITQKLVEDPNRMLREHLKHQHDVRHEQVLSTTTFTVSSTTPGSGIENISFLGTANTEEPPHPDKPAANNAFTQTSVATFWIETVLAPSRRHAGPLAAAKPELRELAADDPARLEPFWEFDTFLQLQYSQVVLLNFREILWPHVTVATLTLSNG